MRQAIDEELDASDCTVGVGGVGREIQRRTDGVGAAVNRVGETDGGRGRGGDGHDDGGGVGNVAEIVGGPGGERVGADGGRNPVGCVGESRVDAQGLTIEEELDIFDEAAG